MASARSTLKVAPRAEFGSRSSRRLRGEGLVPGVVYSGGSEATPFQVSEREVRAIIGEGAALFDLEIEGSKAVPVVVKEQQLHPVRGSLQHIDLQKVKLDEKIQAEVAIELEGADTAPGVKGGGVLEHVTREVTVEALPAEIPDSIVADVSAMEINDTFTLAAIPVPDSVTFVAEDPEEVTIVNISPPRVEEEPEPEVEEETEVVGEGEGAEGEGEAAEGDSGGDSGDSEG
jgi:large subunit ribosomal protein L25